MCYAALQSMKKARDDRKLEVQNEVELEELRALAYLSNCPDRRT
jgi:hypothetical protein